MARAALRASEKSVPPDVRSARTKSRSSSGVLVKSLTNTFVIWRQTGQCCMHRVAPQLLVDPPYWLRGGQTRSYVMLNKTAPSLLSACCWIKSAAGASGNGLRSVLRIDLDFYMECCHEALHLLVIQRRPCTSIHFIDTLYSFGHFSWLIAMVQVCLDRSHMSRPCSAEIFTSRRAQSLNQVICSQTQMRLRIIFE